MNKLKNSKVMLVLSVLLVLVMIGSASAADEAGNETVSTSTCVDALSQEVDSVDEVVSAADTSVVGSKDTNSTLLSSSDNEILKDSSKTLSELDTLIKVTPNELLLHDDYIYDGSVLIINKNNMIIDFNNHTLDANGYSGTVLTINANNVTIKNMKFINGKGTIASKYLGKINTRAYWASNSKAATETDYFGGTFAVLWNGDYGKCDNCTFSNNNVVVEWVGNNGVLSNSVFKNSQHEQLKSTGENFKLKNTTFRDITRMATVYSATQANYACRIYTGYGVSVSSGSVDQCVFENAGELTFEGFADVSLINSNFTNTGGFLTLGGITKNCTFDNIKLPATRDLHWGPIFNANFVNMVLENCTFKNINTNGQTDRFFTIHITASLKNLKFINNDFYVLVGDSEIPFTSCLFENNIIRRSIAATYTGKEVSTTPVFKNFYFDNCTFINNDFKQGYVVRVDGSCSVYNSIFINNTATSGLFYHTTGGSSLAIKNSTFTTNNENKDGWAVYMDSASRVLSLDDLTVFNNKTHAAISPSNYNSNLYSIIYVNQTGSGDGLSPVNRTKLSTNLFSLLESGGIIDFENNGLEYNDIGPFTISAPVTFRGNGATIKKNSRIFTISSSNVIIENFTFRDCKSNDYAPICFTTGVAADGIARYFLTINDCIFINNSGTTAGVLTNIYLGAAAKVSSFGKILTINNCKFYNNTGTKSIHFLDTGNWNRGYYGGAGALMLISADSFVVNNSIFDNNHGVNVGAINTYDSHIVIENSSFTNNHGTNLIKNTDDGGYGGYNSAGAIVIHKSNGNSYIKNCTFENNTSPLGGALYIQGTGFGNLKNGYGSVSVYDSIFVGNNATTNDGGAIYAKSNDAMIDNCTFNHNNALKGDGAAIYLDGNKLKIIDSRFDGNNASHNVIGITTSLIKTFTNDGSVSLVDSNFTNNSCCVINLDDLSGSVVDCRFEDNLYGCIFIDTGVSGQNLNVIDSNFTKNSGDVGSAIYCPVKLSISGSRFTGNNASDYGGAVFIGKLGLGSSIIDSFFINNSAVSHGGALFVGADNVMIQYCEFRNNSANSSLLGGGAIYDDGDVMIITNSLLTGNRANNGYGGGIYINTTDKGIIYYSVDQFTRKTYVDNYCLNHTSEPEGKSWNDVYEGIAFSLLDKVYVVLNPELWMKNNGAASSGDGESWENATWLENALSIVAPYGQLIFVNGEGEVYNSTNCRLPSNVVTFEKVGLSIYGNNTTFSGIHFIISELATSFKLYNSTFIDNNDSCIVWKSTDGLINNCTFKDNHASGDYIKGLGVQALADDLSIVDSKFIGNIIDGNWRPGEGGMLYVNASNVDITYCTFKDNEANYGSHILLSSDSEHVFIEYCEFINGTGIDSFGHAIVIDGGMDVQIISSNFTSNNLRDTGSYDGGAIIGSNINYFVINGCRFENNSASNNGGAISFTGISSLVNIDSSIFIGNYLSGYTIQSTGVHSNGSYGGAIYSPLTVFTSFTGNYFINNNASYGGAISVNNGGKLIITGIFLNNSALNGSAIYTIGDKLNVISSIFASPKYNETNNKLPGYIYSESSVDFENVTLSFTDLDYLINQTTDDTLDLGFNYLYFNDYDDDFVDGVIINKTLVIDGNGYTLDANGSARVFNISSSVELYNLNIINGNHTLGGAIYSTGDLKLNNVTFKNNHAVNGSALYIVKSTNHWDNLTFEGNAADNATVYFDGDSTVYNSDLSFTGNTVGNGLNIVGSNRIHSPVFYVVNNGVGFGIIPSEPTTLTYALNNVLPNGKIYINSDCDINETIKLNNFTNVTFVGNGTTFHRKNNVKYLFIN